MGAAAIAAATVERETSTDFQQTADLATRAFGYEFTASHLEWLYDRAFSRGAIIIAARHEGRKVGQLALVRQSLRIKGEDFATALVVDQCVEPAYRSAPLVIRLYRAMAEQCRHEHIRYIIGMPNALSSPVVERFCKAPPHQRLAIRAGLAVGSVRRVEESLSSERLGLRAGARLFDGILAESQPDGVAWSGEALVSRLGHDRFSYGIDRTANAIVVSRPGRLKGVPVTLVVGCFTRPGAEAIGAELRAAVASACRRTRNPLFVYAGIHPDFAALPGYTLPERMRSSPLTLHMRNEAGGERPLLDRYELIDFDYA